MNELAKRAGLHLVDVVKTPIHGNSYVFVISWNQRPYNIQNLIKMESKLNNIQTYNDWVNTVQHNMTILKATIEKYTSDGYKVVGYGAAAKGMTVLNFGKIKLDFVVDDNPLKQGLYTPGTNISIVGIEELDKYQDSKVAFVPLAWNFFTEIKSRIKEKRNKEGDVFIKYFPTINIE
jgi:hypothetical protein